MAQNAIILTRFYTNYRELTLFYAGGISSKSHIIVVD